MRRASVPALPILFLLLLLLPAAAGAEGPGGGGGSKGGAVRMEEVEVRGRAPLPPYLPEPRFESRVPPAPPVRGLAEEEASRPLFPPREEPRGAFPEPTGDRRVP